jgi:hypothetical protein
MKAIQDAYADATRIKNALSEERAKARKRAEDLIAYAERNLASAKESLARERLDTSELNNAVTRIQEATAILNRTQGSLDLFESFEFLKALANA